MNEKINELRLDAGISQLQDDPRLVVIDRSGKVIDPLVGLEKFAELIVRECMSIIKQGDGLGNEDDFDKGFQAGIAMAYNRVKAQMGVEE